MGVYHATDADYKGCRALLRASSKTFYLSSKILPSDKERSFWAVYAFCRKTDDMADEGKLKEEERLALLAAWKENLSASYRGKKSADPTMRAFADTARRHAIPISYPLLLISGVEKDARGFRFDTFPQLRAYCYSVASVVGLMLLCVMGVRSKQARRHAISLGIAMQLTNIIRDVEEDLMAGRLYLPQKELKRYGLSRKDIRSRMSGRKMARFERLLQFQVRRARHYYEMAVEGIGLLPKELRFAIASCAYLYSKILEEIEKRDYQAFGKPSVAASHG